MFVGEQCGKAEEAIKFYVSLFGGSKIQNIEYWKPNEPGGKEGLVKQATFSLGGQEYMVSENTFEHKFTFTPAISLFVTCENEKELETLFAKLSVGGDVMMPLDNYGFSTRFGWVSDRYGVSWQLNLK